MSIDRHRLQSPFLSLSDRENRDLSGPYVLRAIIIVGVLSKGDKSIPFRLYSPTCLYIIAIPAPESYSAPRVAKALLDSYRQARPEDRIEVLDLYKADIPPFLAPQAKAKYAVLAAGPQSEAEAAWQTVIKTINHFKGFDKYVVSSPMWNFSIPYRLKQYIDVIVQPALTVFFLAR